MINNFRGKYFFLSNFYESPIEVDGRTYKSVEHAFQALKTLNEEDQVWVANADTPLEAKRRGKRVVLRKDWEEVKDGMIFKYNFRRKILQNIEF